MGFETSRVIPAAPEQIFAAISDPARLARWWGPKGFTNTIHEFEFVVGGRWTLTMYSSDGKHFDNELTFLEIFAPHRVVFRHVSKPNYTLELSLVELGEGTLVKWSQSIDLPEIAEKMRHIVVPANEDNLDRLTAEVLGAG